MTPPGSHRTRRPRHRPILLLLLVLASAGAPLLTPGSAGAAPGRSHPDRAVQHRAQLSSLPAIGAPDTVRDRTPRRGAADLWEHLLALGVVVGSRRWLQRRSGGIRLPLRAAVRLAGRGPPLLTVAP